MKRKLLYIFFIAIISFTSMGFGFLEPSAAMHKKTNHHAKSDSLGVNMANISIKNPSVSPREIQKPSDETITKSIVQWVADFVKNTVEKIMIYAVKILQSLAINLIRFFTK